MAKFITVNHPPVTANSALVVFHTSTRRLGHLARALGWVTKTLLFWSLLVLLPFPHCRSLVRQVWILIERTWVSLSHWNTVYKAFHRIRSCENEPIIHEYFEHIELSAKLLDFSYKAINATSITRDLDETNLRTALKQDCRKPTLSRGASILYSHTNLVCVLEVENVVASRI